MTLHISRIFDHVEKLWHTWCSETGGDWQTAVVLGPSNGIDRETFLTLTSSHLCEVCRTEAYTEWDGCGDRYPYTYLLWRPDNNR